MAHIHWRFEGFKTGGALGVCKMNGKSQQAFQNAQHKSTEKKNLNELPQVTFPDMFSYL